MKLVEEIIRNEIDWNKEVVLTMSLKELQIIKDSVGVSDVYHQTYNESVYGLDKTKISHGDIVNTYGELKEIIKDLGGVV